MIFMMATASIFMLSGCGTKIYTSGDFKYWRASKNAYICDLSEEGMEKKIIAIPETIDGYIVNGLKKKNDTYSHIRWYSKNLKKIYIPKEIYIDGAVFANCLKLEKIILFYETEYTYPDFSMALNFEDNSMSYLYVNKNMFEKYDVSYLRQSNVNYYYNYIDSDNNGIFWLDDYDNEQISFIPPEPVRESYIFEGWYKEAECKTKWNFDNDKVPAKIYDAEENYEYIETCLYAKWI
jgi:hypothetical protein